MAQQGRENFGSRIGVILAMAGSAIGLGNIWRFPFVMGQNGGAAFVLIYIGAMLLISLPVFMAEVMIGRRSACNASQSMEKLAPGRPFWKISGLLAVIIPTLIASYYSVIGGWSIGFLFRSCAYPLAFEDPSAALGIFGTFTSHPWIPVAMHLLFLGLCAAVVSSGVKSGIEKFSKVAIPALFVMIVVIMVYSMSLPGARAGIEYIAKPDFRELTPKSFAYALGQSFYSLSLGMGIIITYGSYVSRKESIMTSGMWTAFFDLVFAILAGLAIMPAVFAAGIAPSAGPGLIFQSIPYVFASMGQQMPVLSVIVAIVFFFAVVIAAMTSCISLIEVGVNWIMERFSLSRRLSAKIVFAICAVLGVMCALSDPVFGAFDYVCSNILLMVMAFLSIIFVGFVMRREDVRDEFTNSGTLKGSSRMFGIMYFLIKWVAPVAVLVIFVTNFLI